MSWKASAHLHLFNYSGTSWTRKAISSVHMVQWESSFPERINANTTLDSHIEFEWSLFQSLESEHGTVTYQLDGTEYQFIIFADGKTGEPNLYINWCNVPILTTSTTDWIVQPSQTQIALQPNTIESLKWWAHNHDNCFFGIFTSHLPNYYTKNNVLLTDNVINTLPPVVTGVPVPISTTNNQQNTPLGIQYDNWMTQFYPFIRSTPLNQLCIPGSKDAGCSTLTTYSQYGVCDATFQTQYANIYTQLMHGSRCLDIRPSFHSGDKQWYTSRYYKRNNTHKKLHQNNYDSSSSDEEKDGGDDEPAPTNNETAFGGNGESLDHVITQINQFTATHDELIILYINDPTLITVNGSKTVYRDFDQAQYTALFHKLSTEIEHLFWPENIPKNVQNLSNLPLSTFLTCKPKQAKQVTTPKTPSLNSNDDDDDNNNDDVTDAVLSTSTSQTNQQQQQQQQSTETKRSPCVLILVEPPLMYKRKPAFDLIIPDKMPIYLTSTSFPMIKKRTNSPDILEVFHSQLRLLCRTPLPSSQSDLIEKNVSNVMNLSLYQTKNDTFWAGGLGIWNQQCGILPRSVQIGTLLPQLFGWNVALRDRHPTIAFIDGYTNQFTRIVIGVNLLQGFKRFQNWQEFSGRPALNVPTPSVTTTTTPEPDVVTTNVVDTNNTENTNDVKIEQEEEEEKVEIEPVVVEQQVIEPVEVEQQVIEPVEVEQQVIEPVQVEVEQPVNEEELEIQAEQQLSQERDTIQEQFTDEDADLNSPTLP